MKRFPLTTAFLLIGTLCSVATWYRNRPTDVGPDVPAGRIKSVSFAPFREGFSPLKEIFPLREHLEEDVRLIAEKAESIRTYASLGGVAPLPEIARRFGITITQGAWLGWGERENQREITALVASANVNPDVVTRVIVGNEVLLRGEMEVDRLIDYIREVKQAVRQPVSYADVWSMYMKYPRLIDEVDFITIHILPYWEDEPVSIDAAGAHLEEVVRKVEAEARALGTTKPIFIGESGWPSVGRQRGPAVPSVANAARYTRTMIEVVNRHNFDYNIVEAFNQPWKAELEGTVGANWGLLSADRAPVYPLSGAVTEAPGWGTRLLVTLLLSAAVLRSYARRISAAPWVVLLFAATCAVALTNVVIGFATFEWSVSYSLLERLEAAFWVVTTGLLALTCFHESIRTILPEAELPSYRNPQHLLYLVFALFALYRSYHLALHGRYIDFPLELGAIPALGVLTVTVARILSRRTPSTRPPTEFERTSPMKAIANLLLIAPLAIMVGETHAFVTARDLRAVYPGFTEALPIALRYTVLNAQLWCWAGCLILVSWYLRGGRAAELSPEANQAKKS